MPVLWEDSQGDILKNKNDSDDVIIIFGGSHGGFDFPGLIENANSCDVYCLKDPSRSWYEGKNTTFDGLEDIERYLDELVASYPGKKIFCGISMGGSAALYFGSKYEGAFVLAASPQIFEFQFLWDRSIAHRHLLIEGLPARLDGRKSVNPEVFMCGGPETKDWNWRDRVAGLLARDIFDVQLSLMPCDGHESWKYFSLRAKMEAILERKLFVGMVSDYS